MSSKSRVVLSPVSHIGIVVRDAEKTVEYYSSTFGLGPFSMHEVKMEGVLLRGKPTTVKIKVAFAQAGSVRLELIQPLDDHNIYTEFLDSKGEGLHHLGFQVDDVDSVLAKLSEASVELVYQRSSPEADFAYLSSDKIGGIIFEISDREARKRRKREL